MHCKLVRKLKLLVQSIKLITKSNFLIFKIILNTNDFLKQLQEIIKKGIVNVVYFESTQLMQI